MKMKLRNTRGRALKILKEPSILLKESSCIDDPGEDVTFEDIKPFSPCLNTNKSDSGSDFSNDSGDEWIVPDEPKPKRKREAKKTRNYRRISEKKHLELSTSARERNINAIINERERNINLDLLIDEKKIFEVKNVLKLLPEQFSKGYCKYLYDLQNPDPNRPRRNLIQEAAFSKSNTRPSSRLCVLCEKEFESPGEVAEHLNDHRGPKGYNCICEKTFKTLQQFSCHIRYSHKLFTYECPYCSRNFYGLHPMKLHWKNDHKLSHYYTCTICQKGFPRAGTFLEHINLHTGLRPHKCDRCEKEYSSVQSLTEHTNIHHGKPQLKCRVCEKLFVTEKLLNIHFLSHGEVRKYACDKCDKSFKTIQNLREHKSRHEVEKSFSCEHCSKCFLTRNSLRKHYSIHKNGHHAKKNADGGKNVDGGSKSNKVIAKRFKCSDCEKSFKQKASLKRHCFSLNHDPCYEEKADGAKNYKIAISPAKNGRDSTSIAMAVVEEGDMSAKEDDSSSEEGDMSAKEDDSSSEEGDMSAKEDDSSAEEDSSKLDYADSKIAINNYPFGVERTLSVEAEIDYSELALNKNALDLEKPMFVDVNVEYDSDENEDERRRVLTVL